MVLIFAVEPREEERHVTRKAESLGELRLPGQAESQRMPIVVLADEVEVGGTVGTQVPQLVACCVQPKAS